jgi:hypothetical protein
MNVADEDALTCADCGDPIDLEQYRRKVPRCNECLADVIIAGTDWDDR